jgi:hypothetical protein
MRRRHAMGKSRGRVRMTVIVHLRADLKSEKYLYVATSPPLVSFVNTISRDHSIGSKLYGAVVTENIAPVCRTSQHVTLKSS